MALDLCALHNFIISRDVNKCLVAELAELVATFYSHYTIANNTIHYSARKSELSLLHALWGRCVGARLCAARTKRM